MKITSCKKASRLMSEQLEHPLSLYKLILLKIHFAMCINCIYFGRQIKALRKLIGMHVQPEDMLPSPYASSLSEEARQRIRSAISDNRP